MAQTKWPNSKINSQASPFPSYLIYQVLHWSFHTHTDPVWLRLLLFTIGKWGNWGMKRLNSFSTSVFSCTVQGSQCEYIMVSSTRCPSSRMYHHIEWLGLQQGTQGTSFMETREVKGSYALLKATPSEGYQAQHHLTGILEHILLSLVSCQPKL
jgi:hypothetical protein